MDYTATAAFIVTDLVLAAEMKLLTQNIGAGIYACESSANNLAWDAVIFVSEGLYTGAIFKMRLLIPANYPSTEVPRLVFQPSLFHPAVDASTGELCTQTFWKSWRPHVDRLWHIFAFARYALLNVGSVDVVNEEAAKILKTDPALFRSRAVESARGSYLTVYSQTANTIRFSDKDVSSEILTEGKRLSEPNIPRKRSSALLGQAPAATTWESLLAAGWTMGNMGTI
eukprot:m.226978 g.226978  ORF g.226978 m.226978 type:complete len:227 (-) comp11512_c0_seq1:1714-2394(-)